MQIFYSVVLPPDPVWLMLTALLGACVGSFITLVTYRLPRDEPIGMTRSRCTACLATLRVRDLFPIFSWLFARGRCRRCHARVGLRYPLTELACALIAVGMVVRFGLTLEALALVGLGWCVVALVLTDLEHQMILDEVQVAIALFGILYGVALHLPPSAMVAGAALGGVFGLLIKYGFLWLRKKDGLGWGDVKFLVAAGIWLVEPRAFVPFFFFAGVLGIISGLLWRALGHGERFPFGPALATALWLPVLTPEMDDWFWSLYTFPLLR